MSTATGSGDPRASVHPAPTRPLPPGRAAPAVRAFRSRYTGTLLLLVAGLVAFEFGWQLLADGTGPLGRSWPAAAAATAGWALAVAVALHRRGWTAGPLAAVVAAPAAALAVSAAAGWLSPAGLVLWGPVSTVLVAALALAAQPLRTASDWTVAPDAGGTRRARRAAPAAAPAGPLAVRTPTS